VTSPHSPEAPASDVADRVLAVLAASAHAAALADGAAQPGVSTSPPPGASGSGRPGETETLQLFLLDGLLEAVEWANEGVAADEAACMWLAGLRWGRAVAGTFPAGSPEPLARWIDDAAAVLPRPFAPGDPRNLAGFRRPEMSSTGRSHVPGIDSAGVLPRAAAIALLPHVDERTTARFATDAAALTHGSPAAQQAAAQAALMLRAGLERGTDAAGAWERQAAGGVVPGSAHAALRAALLAAAAAVVRHADDPRAAYAGTLAALLPQPDGTAAGHAATAAGHPRTDTASFGAALIAAVFGTAALPEDWRETTPAAALVLGMQQRWTASTAG
jgi:hypothetical protein